MITWLSQWLGVNGAVMSWPLPVTVTLLPAACDRGLTVMEYALAVVDAAWDAPANATKPAADVRAACRAVRAGRIKAHLLARCRIPRYPRAPRTKRRSG